MGCVEFICRQVTTKLSQVRVAPFSFHSLKDSWCLNLEVESWLWNVRSDLSNALQCLLFDFNAHFTISCDDNFGPRPRMSYQGVWSASGEGCRPLDLLTNVRFILPRKLKFLKSNWISKVCVSSFLSYMKAACSCLKFVFWRVRKLCVKKNLDTVNNIRGIFGNSRFGFGIFFFIFEFIVYKKLISEHDSFFSPYHLFLMSLFR